MGCAFSLRSGQRPPPPPNNVYFPPERSFGGRRTRRQPDPVRVPNPETTARWRVGLRGRVPPDAGVATRPAPHRSRRAPAKQRPRGRRHDNICLPASAGGKTPERLSIWKSAPLSPYGSPAVARRRPAAPYASARRKSPPESTGSRKRRCPTLTTPHDVCILRAKSLKRFLRFTYCLVFPMLLRCGEIKRSLIMICPRCGITSDGTTLESGATSPFCPACASAAGTTPTTSPTRRRRRKPGQPATAVPAAPPRTPKKRKKP